MKAELLQDFGDRPPQVACSSENWSELEEFLETLGSNSPDGFFSVLSADKSQNRIVIDFVAVNDAISFASVVNEVDER